MGSRTVRLDHASEKILAEVTRARKLSVSAALKEGLLALRESIRSEGPVGTPFEVYRGIDLGPGGRARAPARDAKRQIANLLKARRQR